MLKMDQATVLAASRSRVRPFRRSRAALTLILAPAVALGAFVAASPLPFGSSVETSAGAADPVVQGTVPKILGTVRVGETLTVDPGQWGPTGVKLKHEWYVGWVRQSADSLTYTVQPTNLGKVLFVETIGTLDGYTPTRQTSAQYTVLPGQLTAPGFKLSGSARVGEEVRVARTAAWVPSDGVNQNYRWFYDGKPVEPVEVYDAPTHVIRPDGAGTELSVQVIGSKIGYDWKTVTLSGGMVPAPDLPFSLSPVPTIEKVQQPTGLYLSALSGRWDPAPTTLSYQWLRAGAEIPGAEFEFYRPTAADAGKPISVRVRAVKDGYVSTERTSAPILGPGAGPAKPVVKRLSATPKPKIGVVGGGKAKVGKKLTVKAGTWKPAKVTLKYRWLRNGKAIKGATKSKYKLTRKDRGKRISVRVTGKKTGYTTVSRVSSAKRVR